MQYINKSAALKKYKQKDRL